MCEAKVLTDNLIDALQSIKDKASELSDKMSKIDLVVTDIEHSIELGRFDLYKSYLKFKQLQQALQIRREIKDEWEQIQPLKDHVFEIEKIADRVNKKISNKEKTFKYREYKPRMIKDDNDFENILDNLKVQ